MKEKTDSEDSDFVVEFVSLRTKAAREIAEQFVQTMNGKPFSARNVLDWAEANPNTTVYAWLHSESDKALADKWRLEECGRLIRLSKYVQYLSEERERIPKSAPLREFVAPDPKNGFGYQRRDIVKADPALRATLVANAVRELEMWCRKYEDFNELEGWRTLIRFNMTKPTEQTTKPTEQPIETQQARSPKSRPFKICDPFGKVIDAEPTKDEAIALAKKIGVAKG